MIWICDVGRRPLKRVLSQNGAIRSEYEEEMKKVPNAAFTTIIHMAQSRIFSNYSYNFIFRYDMICATSA